jgi:glycosyltransferase involved in cell wall biosynthesis
VSWNREIDDNFKGAEREDPFEPYIVVLGTIEPRKNIELLLHVLSGMPDILQKYKVIFLGKPGWLIKFEDVVEKYFGTSMYRNKIIYPGFVSDRKKYLLLKNAAFTIYPSLYEGFGLPVLESLSLGAPVVTSWSTSLSEVGGNNTFYFDPYKPESLEDAIYALNDTLETDRDRVRKACFSQAEKFSWELFCSTALQLIYQNARMNSSMYSSR